MSRRSLREDELRVLRMAHIGVMHDERVDVAARLHVARMVRPFSPHVRKLEKKLRAIDRWLDEHEPRRLAS